MSTKTSGQAALIEAADAKIAAESAVASNALMKTVAALKTGVVKAWQAADKKMAGVLAQRQAAFYDCAMGIGVVIHAVAVWSLWIDPKTTKKYGTRGLEKMVEGKLGLAANTCRAMRRMYDLNIELDASDDDHVKIDGVVAELMRGVPKSRNIEDATAAVRFMRELGEDSIANAKRAKLAESEEGIVTVEDLIAHEAAMEDTAADSATPYGQCIKAAVSLCGRIKKIETQADLEKMESVVCEMLTEAAKAWKPSK